MARAARWCIEPGCGQISYTDDSLCEEHAPPEYVPLDPPRWGVAGRELPHAIKSQIDVLSAIYGVPPAVMGLSKGERLLMGEDVGPLSANEHRRLLARPDQEATINRMAELAALQQAGSIGSDYFRREWDRLHDLYPSLEDSTDDEALV